MVRTSKNRMFRFITIGIVALVATFGAVSAQAYVDPFRAISIDIMNRCPASDERYKFAAALRKSASIQEANTEHDGEFAPNGELMVEGKIKRAIQLVEPFLKSQNENIRLCAEDVIRLDKSRLEMYIVIRQDCSQYEQEMAYARWLEDLDQCGVSFVVFARSCL
jgi:hypothetical protein